RDRGADAVRLVVAARRGLAAGHLLASDGVDAGVDRVADLRVVDRALDDPLAALADVLRREEDGVVRLVPRGPVVHRRERASVVALVGAAVADRGRPREVAEPGEVRRRVIRGLA